MRGVPARQAVLALAVACATAAPAAWADPAPAGFPGPSSFVRGAYQAGAVLGTNDFLNGDNAAGRPIDSYHSVRLEYGRHTDGSRDWHHAFNFPSYGLGIYGADFFNDEELGTPTSLYGFFVWPLGRSGRWTFEFETAFGFTHNWKSYDPVDNPHNIALGLGRSVHIEGGPAAAYRLADRWSLIGAATFTHFSNGGTQNPNHGLNTVAPMLYVKYDTSDPVPIPTRRAPSYFPPGWDLTTTFSSGRRNLNLELAEPALRGDYLNRDYFIGNLTLGLGRAFSNKTRVVGGLDFCYDESVPDLIVLDGINRGVNARGEASDKLELAAFAGYELTVNRTHALLHLGYKLWYRDVPGRLPEFYQRLGIKHFVYGDWFVGLNVRFHELGSADNLEWNVGYAMEI
ncbi:acyloxyacyl hydrolase [bacterium]|nr:acyloxyacyl hydrolase [bacterium]